VLIGFFGLVAIAALVLVTAWRQARDRAWFWRAVGGGGAALAGAVVVVGALFALFFEAAFEVFHRLLFAGGSYTFDPRQERLVQLFPEDFWSETSIALAVVILVLALVATWFGLRRAGSVTIGERRSSATTRQAVS
jgi:integral membrane protein (TIGR01906 family)